jgi:hypothetical protein
MQEGSQIILEGGDGSSIEGAVIIKIASGVPTESLGLEAEYGWLSVHYPKYQLVSQSLIFAKDKPYDLMVIELPDGTQQMVCFEISSFYGKW